MRKYRKSADRVGEKYGHWTVIGIAPRIGTSLRFECRCDCDNRSIVYAKHLIYDRSSSGCQQCANKWDGASTKNPDAYSVWLTHREKFAASWSGDFLRFLN